MKKNLAQQLALNAFIGRFRVPANPISSMYLIRHYLAFTNLMWQCDLYMYFER